jgi:hypothetical protein
MPTNRIGHNDTQQSARLNFFKNTTYPTALANTYLGIFGGSLPVSDGSGGTEISPATRPSVTFGAVSQDANGRHYIANSAAVTGIVLSNTSPAEVTGYGIFSATSGGSSLYTGTLYPYQVAAGATISFPVGSIRIYAEPPTF